MDEVVRFNYPKDSHSDDSMDAFRYSLQLRARHISTPYPTHYLSTQRRSNWYADYIEEQKPTQVEIEPELGFIRYSWFEDGRFKVRRVPIVHG